jgi:hypothetical protein
LLGYYLGYQLEAFMKNTLGKLLLGWAALGCVASPAAAQTGRIEALSHGGSAGGAAEDNFGIVRHPRIKLDSIVEKNDSVATWYSHVYYEDDGQEDHRPRASQTKQYYYPQYEKRSHEQVVADLREEYKGVKFVGFDHKKKKSKKLGMHPGGQPTGPGGPGAWLALLALGGLAVGWRFGEKPRLVAA